MVLRAPSKGLSILSLCFLLIKHNKYSSVIVVGILYSELLYGCSMLSDFLYYLSSSHTLFLPIFFCDISKEIRLMTFPMNSMTVDDRGCALKRFCFLRWRGGG